MELQTSVTVDEWAQANVLKALDELIAGEGAPEDTVSEDADAE